MTKERNSISKAALTVTVGLALALVVASGSRLKASESGGYQCGYGNCQLQYWDCLWTSYEDLGSGECEVTTNVGCNVSYSCTGPEFEWFAVEYGSKWSVRQDLNRR